MAPPPPTTTSRAGGGVWGFILVFICAIVTIDVLYIHQKGFRQSLEAHGIEFNPPQPEQHQEKPWEKKKDGSDEEEGFPPEKNPVEQMEEMKAAQEEQMKAAEEENEESDENERVADADEQDNGHKVAGLSCKNYGGPSDEDAAEMVFWQDIPEDALFVSPYKRNETQYLTFEPDEGGWNNIRMRYGGEKLPS